MQALDLHRISFATIYEETVKLKDISDYDFADQDEVVSEITKASEISSRYKSLMMLEKCLKKEILSEISNHISNQSRRKVKVPQIKLEIFGDEIKNWLLFLGQLKKIHLDLFKNED